MSERLSGWVPGWAACLCRLSKVQLFALLLLCVVATSYLMGLWAVEVSSRTVNGTIRYHVIARFNLLDDNVEPIVQSGEKQRSYLGARHFHNDSHQLNQTAFAFPTSLTARELSDIAIPAVQQPKDYSCKKLIAGDPQEQQKVLSRSQSLPILQPKDYIEMTEDCGVFQKNRTYAMYPLSSEEADFPIAYSMVIFKDIEMFERLLRAIYRPQNYYCLHVDAKASAEYLAAVKGIAACFDNVLLAPRRIDVQWAWFSVLEPELVCMELLWRYWWRYFINLTGQEFPLKTNWELVKILKALNGANNMEGTVKRRNKGRTEYVHHGMSATRTRKTPVPVPVTFTKGSLHILAQRGYVDYVLHDPRALLFRDWVNDTGVPDETFFTTLNYSPNLKVPGAYLGEPETDEIDVEPPHFPRNPFITRFKNWGDGPFNWPCGGQRVRQVCVFGVRDLPLLAKRKELFANKFYIDYQAETYACMEQLHYERTRQEVLLGSSIDTTFYSRLDSVTHHVE